MTVYSDIPYSDLVAKLADIMSLPPKKVHVAYRFSTQPRSAVFSHLSSRIHLMELVSIARRTVKTTKSQKEFIVELKDLDVVGGKGKGKMAPAKKGAKEKKRKRGEDSSESEAGTGDEQVDGKRVRSGKKSMPQIVAELESANTCTEHGGHGCLKFTTGHVKLSKQDLSTWAIFMLQIGGDKPVASGKSAAQAAPMPSAFPGPPSYPYPSPYPYAPWPPYQTPQAPRHRHHYDIPSSDPIEEVEDSQLFPRLQNWLQNLDDGSRGRDGHNFIQFADDFDHEKYIRIVDLEGLQIMDLTCLIPGMAHGTAAKIVAYAAADIAMIRKREKKCLRAEGYPRYT
ncbi:hypothetical protein C8J57DRAFT_1643222 [Mycena rebaudengoi]|nr:hypothetical protein C8J57DRAFT_1643222 [Mycena rebaudengoi]